MNFIQNYQTHIISLLEDAKYFYILNDFIHYPEFQKLKIKRKFAKETLQKSKNKELNKLGQSSIYYLIFNLLMEQSYYNWNLKQIDFEKLQIQKIITDKNNSSFDDY
ncbi:hypothetical protein ACVRXF_01520 [Streptococcus orisasini]|uniref:hypothetical protein n=1 Tax=Streptococcus orisasini TaxID=1080071 RepID=UPI000708AE99|nr:hypothetical protein [Streptococcus orisasini]